MKRLFMQLMCFLAMMAASLSAKAQDIKITLLPGWTWISYPKAEAMDIPTALGDFVPMEGDIIKSQFSSTSYTNGQWRGRLMQFTPGMGYHYYSMRGEPTTLVFAGSTPQAQVQVTTSEPMLITAISAMSGGEVTVSDGTYIIVKGLCWAAHENPTTNDDFYEEAESGVGSFTISMTDLNISTTYYVRAYAVTANGTVYGDQKNFTTQDGIPTLTTAEVANIGSNWATSGGNITDNGGLNVMARGVCWSTSPNPTIDDYHTTDGTGIGSFDSYLTGLNVSTTYYLRSYATTSAGTAYGEQKSFTTFDDLTQVWVDLGLPSGTMWATCNVGAESPWDYGYYFCWGATSPNGGCGISWNPDDTWFDKYWGMDYFSEYGPGIGDNLTNLEPNDDAALANWGNDWRMPSQAEWQELLNNTTVTWVVQNNVNGRLFTATNGNSLFLPATGSCWDNKLFNAEGHYWSSSLTNDFFSAWMLYFNSDNCEMDYGDRCGGKSVRAVRAGLPLPATGTINGLFSVSDDSQVYFSQGDLQYNASADTWRFALAQYDYIGSNNSNISSSYDGYIDLFGWGTSGYYHGAVCYQPWKRSQTDNNYYAYGNYQYNLNDQTGQADWGYNAISNGGNQENVWRTLTTQEWQYVFNTRTTASGIRYAKAEVAGVCGVILLPDNWSNSYYNLSNFNNGNAAYNSNIITSSQWSVLELYGAVFLPAAGIRNGTSVSGVGSYGRYWSSSYYDSDNAYHVYFNDSNLYTDYSKNRCRGRSVRLVAPAEN